MTQDNFIGYLIGYAVAFLVGIFITRAIFSIPRFLKAQKTQVQLLLEIAKKMEVNPERLNVIVSEFKGVPVVPIANQQSVDK